MKAAPPAGRCCAGVLRSRLTVAGILAIVAVPLALASLASGQAPRGHTCTPTDRQFIDTTELNLTAVTLWGGEYTQGAAGASDVVAQTKDAAARIAALTPTDPSLQQARHLLGAMFIEYASAIQLEKRHKLEAGHHMYAAYGLANFAHDVLTQAEPALA